ncbi:MAG TPA: GNAT family N-acetyltransferase [Gemmataceae bacterium]|nr:GNAT family N-acetyltransferase [Gemmataceae bacterium]
MCPADVLIRPATPADVPELDRLIPESARRLSPGFYTPAEVEAAVVHVFGVDSQLIADGTYFVAMSEGRIVGCGGWSRRKTVYGGDRAKGAGADALIDPATDPARIRAFFIHPDWARRGIGRRLLATCEAAARAAGFAAAELVATLPGEPLYAACGYAVLERLSAPTPGGVGLPVVRMGKRLT